ncbi:MAG: hypothetical protein ACR2KV_13695, partial [Solirubrobacteraceae bacterium]
MDDHGALAAEQRQSHVANGGEDPLARERRRDLPPADEEGGQAVVDLGLGVAGHRHGRPGGRGAGEKRLGADAQGGERLLPPGLRAAGLGPAGDPADLPDGDQRERLLGGGGLALGGPQARLEVPPGPARAPGEGVYPALLAPGLGEVAAAGAGGPDRVVRGAGAAPA